MSHQTFEHYVTETLSSVLHHGFKKILLLNSHGGNQGISQVIIEKIGFRYPESHFVLCTWWQIANKELRVINESGKGGTGHACEFETSLMMLIAPELVRSEKIERGKNQPNFDWATGDMLYGSNASYYKGMKKMTPQWCGLATH